jgi:hypothetical protein
MYTRHARGVPTTTSRTRATATCDSKRSCTFRSTPESVKGPKATHCVTATRAVTVDGAGGAKDRPLGQVEHLARLEREERP